MIIPAFNGGERVGEAIRSVLDQSYGHFELLVVDDASTDETASVVARFSDRRLKQVRHTTNLGVQAARRTGFDASVGEIVAFLDQDDLFHRDKLDAHVSFLQMHPEVGFTYNSHFTLLDTPGRIAGIWRPPERLTLGDLVLGFPIPPSVWVLRREWADRDEFWDQSTTLRGAEVVVCGRLFLAGCRFSFVDRVLNYRRIHVGRRFADPASKCREERLCQAILLNDARCPPELRSVRDAAAAGNYLVWANVAFAQKETETGWSLLREALRLDRSLTEGRPSRFIEFILHHAITDARDPEAQLRTVFGQLPPELFPPSGDLEWAVGQAHLIRGAQQVVWREADGAFHFERARALGMWPDDIFMRRLAHQLLIYESEFGVRQTREVIRRLDHPLAAVGGRRAGRRLRGAYYLGRAFRDYARGRRPEVPSSVIRALIHDPRCLSNRGAWSILLRTVWAPRFAGQQPDARQVNA